MSKVKAKDSWNLGLLYRGLNDPQIERDIVGAENACAAFEKTYRDATAYLTSRKALKKALADYEALQDRPGDQKPIAYFWYRKELDSADHVAEAKLRLFEERLVKAANRIQFFELSLGKISKPEQKKILADTTLARYRRFLERIFETAQHDLSEPEEKILALKAAPASGMWVSGLEAARNKLTVLWKGKTLPIHEALELIGDLTSQKDRSVLWSSVLDALEGIADFSESELNAIGTDKKINDELRSFKEPYGATILGYENEVASVLDMVATVTKRFDISHRFYRLKKKLLKLGVMHYEDRAAPMRAKEARYTFSESLKLVRDAFGVLDPKFCEIVDTYAHNGQLDVYPKRGKSGGAFCSHLHGLPTYILLNHVDTFNSFTTLAHEAGHGIHSELSAAQPVWYEGYSTAVAETASTFFEGVAFDHATKHLKGVQRIKVLHDRIQNDISTIFRQIAFFNFELELHRSIRAKGWLPHQEIMAMLSKHLHAQLGPAVTLGKRDGLSYIYIGHFRNPFYVYSYAYGLLISKALRERVKVDPSYVQKVTQFLSAGRSKKPEQIFKDIGIEVGPRLFNEGLRSIEYDLDELERLMRHTK